MNGITVAEFVKKYCISASTIYTALRSADKVHFIGRTLLYDEDEIVDALIAMYDNSRAKHEEKMYAAERKIRKLELMAGRAQ